MMISTRGRYALRVMIDLAECHSSGYVPLKDVAARQEISLKYIERIVPILTKNKLIEGVHGKGGGYRLCREPDEYKVGEILRLTEGSLAPVACLEEDAPVCHRAAECRTLPLWRKLDQAINDCLNSFTLADLIRTEAVDNYVI